jgi:hypothetical protein
MNITNSINTNLNPFISIVSSINNSQKPEKNTNSNLSNQSQNQQNKTQNEIKESFSIFDSTGNLEKVFSKIEDKKDDNKNTNQEIKEPSKDIFGQNQQNFFTNIPKVKSEPTETKKITNSSLFPGLGLQKTYSEPQKVSKSPLFPGLNEQKNSKDYFSNENKNKPIFPGGNLEKKNNKSSLFVNGQENKGLFSNKVEEINVNKDNQKEEEEEKNEKKCFDYIKNKINIDNKMINEEENQINSDRSKNQAINLTPLSASGVFKKQNTLNINAFNKGEFNKSRKSLIKDSNIFNINEN